MFRYWRHGTLSAVFISAIAVCSALAQTAAPPPSQPQNTAPAAKAPAPTVDLQFHPAIGSRWIFLAESRETKKQNNLQSENYTIREKSECTVESAFSGGFRLKCTQIAMTLEGLHPYANLMRYMGKVMQGIPVIIDTNDRGAPVQIANFESVRTRIIAGLDEYEKNLKKDQEDDLLAIKATRAQYQKVTASTIPEILTPDYISLTNAQGLRNVVVGQEQAYVDKTVDPQSGVPMRALARLKLARTDDKTGMAVVEWYKEVYDEDLRQILAAAVQKMKPELPPEAAEFLADMTRAGMVFDDKATYFIAPADGVTRNMERTITVKSEAYENIKTTIISFQPAQ